MHSASRLPCKANAVLRTLDDSPRRPPGDNPIPPSTSPMQPLPPPPSESAPFEARLLAVTNMTRIGWARSNPCRQRPSRPCLAPARRGKSPCQWGWRAAFPAAAMRQRSSSRAAARGGGWGLRQRRAWPKNARLRGRVLVAADPPFPLMTLPLGQTWRPRRFRSFPLARLHTRSIVGHPVGSANPTDRVLVGLALLHPLRCPPLGAP